MEAEPTNLPRIEAPAGMQKDEKEVRNFAENAFSHMRDHLSDNRQDYNRMKASSNSEPKSVEEVLAIHNTRSLDVRACPFENPKVTLWLKDCPIWANDSWRGTIYPQGINAYNGQVEVVFDVRPF